MQYKYEIEDVTEKILDLKVEDLELLSPYSINSRFKPLDNLVDLEIYNLDGDKVATEEDFLEFKVLGGSEEGTTNIELDPETDIKRLGFELGDIIIKYRFYSEFFTSSKRGGELHIVEISDSRTELKALPFSFSISEYREEILKLIEVFKISPNFPNIYLKVGEENYTCINVYLDETGDRPYILFKMYEPLPVDILPKVKFRLREEICYPISYKVSVEILPEEIIYPTIKGANFSVEALEGKSNSTPYLNYEQLFGYSIENINYELHSKIGSSGIDLGIDYSDFENFIHFSSAEERIRNFKYKLDLITQHQVTRETLPSGSVKRQYYDGLLEGILQNFDHYDRYLYYGTGTSSWPKTNTSKPFMPIASTESSAITWFDSKILEAQSYDELNQDRLINTVPTFIQEDSNNEAYLLFVDMVGQHFDNIWIYTKSISERYNADNRLDRGIPKDLVKAAVEGLGISIKDSAKNLENLFSVYVGENTSSGEQIETFEKITSDFDGLQPLAQKEYQQEIYKRIYHNIPFLLKTKGTERGLRALVNCFGIPESILSIKTLGGIDRTGQLLSPTQPQESNKDKIRLDSSGSIVGETLSSLISIQQPLRKYTDDSHTVEIGFNISNTTNENLSIRASGSFNIDAYIGDPREVYEPSYDSLLQLEKELVGSFDGTDSVVISPKAFVRLVKFFDASLFRTIKDFLPARALVDTGVIVDSNILHRSKTKQISLGIESGSYSGSVSMETIEGGDAGAYPPSSLTFFEGIGIRNEYEVDYNILVTTPLGTGTKSISGGQVKFTGELSDSILTVTDGEVGSRNPFLETGPKTLFNMVGVAGDQNASTDETVCSLEIETTLLGSLLDFEILGGGIIQITSAHPDEITVTGSLSNYVHDFTLGNLTFEARPTAPYLFEKWDRYNDTTSLYEDMTEETYQVSLSGVNDTQYKWRANFTTTPTGTLTIGDYSSNLLEVNASSAPTSDIRVTIGYQIYGDPKVRYLTNLILYAGTTSRSIQLQSGQVIDAGIVMVEDGLQSPTEAGGYIWEWEKWYPNISK